jgi:hypothetical protein
MRNTVLAAGQDVLATVLELATACFVRRTGFHRPGSDRQTGRSSDDPIDPASRAARGDQFGELFRAFRSANAARRIQSMESQFRPAAEEACV